MNLNKTYRDPKKPHMKLSFEIITTLVNVFPINQFDNFIIWISLVWMTHPHLSPC